MLSSRQKLYRLTRETRVNTHCLPCLSAAKIKVQLKRYEGQRDTRAKQSKAWIVSKEKAN